MRNARLARIFAVLLAVTMIAAACSSSDDGDVSSGDNGSSSSGDGGLTDPESREGPPPAPVNDFEAISPGVTDDTIKVGISMLDFDLLKELGLSTEGWGDQQDVWQVFIDDLNDRGGINGRMIEPVYDFYSPLGTEEAEAACLKLTEDNETFAVLGGFLGPAEPANTCVTALQGRMMVGGRITNERLSESTAPWYDVPARRERRLFDFLGLLEQDGRLTADTKLAIVGSVEQQDVYNIAEGIVQQFGVDPVFVGQSDAPQGSLGAEDTAWQALSERIRDSGADTVLIIGSGQAAMRNIANTGLDVEAWVLEQTDLSNLGANTTAEMADGAITIGGLTDEEMWNHETVAPCRETFTAARPDVELKSPLESKEGDERWFQSIMNYCRWLSIFEQIVTAAGDDLNYQTVGAAADGLGDFVIPGHPFASLAPGKPDITDTVRLLEFDMDLGERGDLSPLTDVADATP